MSKFKNATKQLDELFKQLSDNRVRRQAAQERIENAKSAITQADEALRSAILKDDKKQIKAYEAEVQKLRDEIIRRDSLLIEGLDKEAQALEPVVTEKQAAQKKHFADNAARILQAEIGTHDRLARELIQSTKRLLTIYQLTRDAGHPEAYRDTVGDALQFIPESKIPVIAGFNRTQHLQSSHFGITTNLLVKLKNEIEEA